MRDHTLSISLYCVCEKSSERELICEKCEDRKRERGPERRVKDKLWALRERTEGNIRNKKRQTVRERLWERFREAVESEQNNISRFIPCPHLTIPDTNTFIHMQSDTATNILTL